VRAAKKMNRNRAVTLVVGLALAVAGCGGGNNAASEDAAPEATATATEPTPAPGKCDEVTYTPSEAAEWTHPDSNFYAPDASSFPAKEDLDHLLLHDNAVVVTYAAKTSKKTRERLYDWTFADVVKRTPIVVPDSSPDALPVRARIATIELRCNSLNWKRLTAFANRTDIAPLPRDG
jgi:hypothetical protein